jgi:LuxR family maltose regulon positive regulatory protein
MTISKSLPNQGQGFALTQRETEVLSLINDGLMYKQISRKLYVSINTVKRHTKGIFRKLGVHSRKQAVTAAREYKML